MDTPQPMKWLPIEPSEQDLEFMALREKWWQKCFSAFALSPQELGVVGNLNAMQWEMTKRAAERSLKRGIVKVLRERKARRERARD